MAAALQKQKKYGFQLPLKVASKMLTELNHEHLESVYKAFSKDMDLINRHFQNINLPFIKVKNVSYLKGHDITFTFEVETEEELNNFYTASKMKVLSKVLTDFASETGMGIGANLIVADGLDLSMELRKTDYLKHMLDMCEDDNDSGQEHVSSMKNVKPEVPLPTKETLTITRETPETNKRCRCDLYIFLARSKANIDCISLRSECQELNGLHLKPVLDCDGMWEGYAEVPVHKMRSASYNYEAQRWEGLMFKSKKIYVSNQKYINGGVRRYEFLANKEVLTDVSTKEGYLAHCRHIMSLCNRSDVFDYIIQVEHLSRWYVFRNFDEVTEIIGKLQSTVLISNSRALILLAVILMINVRNILMLLDTNCIQQDMVRAMLKSFKTVHFVKFSDCCKGYLPDLLQSLCKHLYGKDYNLLCFMHETYPFLDEHFFIKEIRSQWVSNPKQIPPADGQSFEILKDIIFIIARRIEMTVPAVRLLEKLFLHLPPPLSLKCQRYLFSVCLASGNDVHSDLKYKLQSILTASVLANISAIVSQGRIRELCDLLEVLQDEEGVALRIRDKLQCSLVNFVEKRTERILPNTLKSLEKIILNSKLFLEKEKQEELLRVLGLSKVKEFHGLFIAILRDSKFRNSVIDCPGLVSKWLETAVKRHVKIEDSAGKEGEICPCYSYLHDALSLPNLPEDGHLQEELKEYVFKWLFEQDPRSVVRKLEDMAKLNKEKCTVLDIYQKHVHQLLTEKCDSTKPDEILLAVCRTEDRLRINSGYTSRLVQKIMEMYCSPFGNDQYDNFMNMVKISKFWMLLLNMEGINIDSIQNHEILKKGMKCLEFILESLASNKITCGYLDKISQVQDAKDLLAAIAQKSRMEVETLWKNAASDVQIEKEKVTHMVKVLNKVRKCIPYKSLPAGWNEFEGHFIEIDKKLKGGKLSTGDVLDSNHFWLNCPSLPCLCEKLIEYIDSHVFWNACLHILINKPEVVEQKEQYLEEEDEPFNLKELSDVDNEVLDEKSRVLNSLKHLDAESNHKSGSFESCIHFLEVLERYGGLKYGEDWIQLCKDEDVPMIHIEQMFENADIVAEISLYEKNHKISINKWKCKALYGIQNLSKYRVKVKAMKMTLHAFEIPLSSDQQLVDAVTSFEQTLTQSITLKQVFEAIQTIHDIVSALDEDKVEVLRVLGESRKLIQFLNEMADTDLRILIDAVEEVSEQSVNETTVFDLIDVKRILQPVLKKNIESDFRSLFQTITKQMKEMKPTELVGKIIACRENLHNLKSLYSNVANRGLKTREIIDKVIKMGDFCFEIGTGDGCVLGVEYTHNQKITTHGQDTLIDLRSTALLLMNTDSKFQTLETTKKKENLETFVKHVDIALEIGQFLTNLHTSGHFKYKKFETQKKARFLQCFKDELSTEYSNWCARLEDCREKHYWMNFILGNQFHIIHDFLEAGGEKREVLSMLQFIHPDIKIDGMKEYYSKLSSDGSESSHIENIALTLEHVMKDLQPVSRPIELNSIVSSRITDFVRPGKLSIVTLEENSKLVMKTVLALYYNTVRKLPEPHQILFCNQDTTWVEIQLLLHRSVRSKIENLFCIANVEMLSNEIQFQLVEALHNLSMYQRFLLGVICCGTQNHPFVNEFFDCIMPVHPLSDTAFTNILQNSWPNVCSITSDIPGLGKTETIRQRSRKQGKGIVTFHISGPLNKAKLVERLTSLRVRSHHVLHIDIGNVDDTMELDAFLFEIIVLGLASAGRSCVSLPTKHIFIEIANTINHQLKDALHTAISFKRENLSWQDYDNFIVSNDVNSPVQVVCQYLNALTDGTIDSKDIYFTGKKAVYSLPRQKCQQLLKKFVPGTGDMSFNMAKIFINVLADQLKKMSCSTFFRTQHLTAALGEKEGITVKSDLLRAILDTSSEFASRSVNNCRMLQASAVKSESEAKSKAGEFSNDSYENTLLKRTEDMIRWEDSNHLIFMFHNQDMQTLSVMYRDKSKVPDHIREFFESQTKKALPDFKSLTSDELQDILQRVARTNPAPLSKKNLKDMAKDYALTPDNLLKMILIMMRIKAHVPVIIMGETGCGKTSLIWYLSRICEVSFKVVQIHAGVDEDYILEKIQKISRKAENNLANPLWLFLDEINTCNHLGLICDILCHHKCLSQMLPPNLVVMAACNPYKLRLQNKVLTAGLQGKIKTDEMSRLVYRVFPLPETMVDYVWDFGSISEKDEKVYIYRMIQNVFEDEPKMDQLLADLTIMSQQVVRKIEDSDSCVSLRDVNRCQLLAKWFQKWFKKKKGQGLHQGKDFKIQCMILALAHCYHSRFANASDRKMYRTGLADVLRCHKINDYDEVKIQDIITKEQKDILKRMELPAGTAQNTALQENVFVILVCILNHIPIFVVGKPGCSKSLSMQVIRSNLRGKDSKDLLFQSLPLLNCVSFQGSESSTSDGIIKVFEKAQRYQENNDPEEVLSVVILDEIGLAEISRFNPLKVLHSLLQPKGKQFPDVAVVGISNWALDAAKMNRAIHLSRPEMDVEELFLTGQSISKSMKRKPADSNHEFMHTRSKTLNAVEMNKELKLLADSYMKYTEKQIFANFHGLRDYYSLVKYIARTLAQLHTQETTDVLKVKIITKGLQRNFGGLPSELSTLQELFIANLHSEEDYKVSIIDLIEDNIQDKMARHLMLITSGDVVLDILEQQLDKLGREKITIYGSHFEEDLTDDYNYRILNKIIICMEQGLVLILKDLDSIYGSLYDMLNQNYTVVGEKKNCRVALGPYSNPMCQVHDDFRCIVLMDKSKIDIVDPPFLNRFEKQNFKFADILSQNEHAVIKDLEDWVQQLTNIPTKQFEVVDVFPVYGADMIPSLVHKCFLEMEENRTLMTENEFVDKLTSFCKEKLLWIMKPESIIRLGSSEFGTNSKTSKQMQHITNEYLHLPIHQGLQKYLQAEINKECERSEHIRMFMIFTNSNIHTNAQALLPNITCHVDKLGAFKSEKQLTQRIQHFWSEPDQELLVLQCRPLDDEAHILLARNIIERTRHEYMNKPNASIKHVCMVMHLDRMKNGSRAVPQINFLTEWKLVMLDSLEEPRIPLLEAVNKSVIETINQKRPLHTYIEEQLFWAFTRIQYAQGGRDFHSIHSIIEQIQSSEDFLTILDEAIFKWIEEQENLDVKNWQVKVACDSHALHSASTFNDALENHIAQVINDPLARIVFELEKMDALSAFFQEDSSANVKSIWRKLFNDPKLFSIQNTPKPTEAECYICSSPILHFRVPFFKVFYEQIETTKSCFLEAVQNIKSALGIEDIYIMPEIWEELLSNQENIITQEVPELEKITYSNWIEDYKNDFFNLASYQIIKGFSTQERSQAMRWCVLGEVQLRNIHSTSVISDLHAGFWIHFGLFHSELQLLDMCKEVLEEEKGGLASMLQSISKDNEPIELIPLYTTDQNGELKPSENIVASTGNAAVTVDDSMQERDHSLDDSSATETYTAFRMHDTVEKPDDEIPVSDVEVSIKPHQDKKKRSELLVEHLCKILLPQDSTLSRYSDVNEWHQRVTSVLAFACQVSMDPSVLHALRLCCDISVQIVLPQPGETNGLKQLGLLLQNDLPLDSNEIRELLRNIIETGKNIHSDNAQKLIAAYCSRCIGANPDTEIMSWLMNLISDGSLPDNTLTNLKPPIHHALHTELGLDSDIYLKLLDSEDGSLKLIEESPFLMAIDACLQKLYEDGLVDSPFPALLIDVLEQDIMRKRITKDFAEASSTSKTQVHYFLRADSILQTDTFSLRHATAIAYMRSFMKILSIYLEETNYDTSDCQVVMQTINAILSQKDKRVKSMQVFLLKCLGNDKWVFQLQRICQKLSNHFQFFSEDSWQRDFDLTSVEMSPISLHVSQRISTYTSTFDAAKAMKAIEALIQVAMLSTEEMICLNNEVMRHFYMKRLISELNDTEKTHCRMIVNCAKELKLEKKTLMVLECFSGTADFQVEMLQVHEGSPSLHKNLASFIGHLLVMMTVYGSDAGKPLSFFAKCLMNPTCLSDLYIPGMPDILEDKSSVQEIILQIPLTCVDKDKRCRVLKEDSIVDLQTSTLHKLEKKFKCMSCKGYCLEDASKLNEIYFGSRKISRFLSTVLHILLHGCLVGSIAVGFASVDDVYSLVGTELKKEDTVSLLVQKLETELRFLSSYLGFEQHDAVAFLHIVLYETKALLCSDSRSMALETERAEWENEFSERIEILVADRFARILDFRRRQNSMFGMPGEALENLVQEVCELELEERTQTLPSLWRSTVMPSFDNLVLELEERKENFQFLKLVLSNLSQIKLMKHIFPIVQWHLTCFVNVSYKFKKREVEDIVISYFLHKESDDKRRQLIKDRFEQFMKAWDDIMENRETLQEFDPEFPELKPIHSQLQLKSCLYDGPKSTIFKVLSTLVCMQNRLIDETLKIAVKAKPMSLNFLRRGAEAMIPCASLTHVTSRDIVNFQWDDSFLKYSQNDVRYGYGRRIVYDFETIEAEVASEMLTNVKYLITEDSLPRIIFADELFQNYVVMIDQIQKNIDQEPLPSEMVFAINKKKDQDPRQVSDFLTHLGMILSLLKKTSGKPETSLVDYVDRYRNILTRPFPKNLLPNPENSIKLCHLVSLHELLEELNADSIINSLPQTFRVKLTLHTQRKVSDLLSMNSKLAELTLKAVKHFAHRCLSSENVDIISERMCNYLCDASFWPIGMVSDGVFKYKDFVQDLQNLFTEDVTVQNVYPLFQLIRSKVEEHEQKDQHTSLMLQSLPTQTKPQGTWTSRKRAAQMYRKT